MHHVDTTCNAMDIMHSLQCVFISACMYVCCHTYVSKSYIHIKVIHTYQSHTYISKSYIHIKVIHTYQSIQTAKSDLSDKTEPGVTMQYALVHQQSNFVFKSKVITLHAYNTQQNKFFF